MAKIHPSFEPKFSRADLAGFLKLLDDDSLLLCSVYIAHEEKQRDASNLNKVMNGNRKLSRQLAGKVGRYLEVNSR
jgi:hypothetical protein